MAGSIPGCSAAELLRAVPTFSFRRATSFSQTELGVELESPQKSPQFRSVGVSEGIEGVQLYEKLAPQVGLEPTTLRLTAES